MKSNSPIAARVSLGLAAALALSIPLGITIKDANDLALLRKTAEVANAKIVKKHCENHGKLSYSYTVDGRIYQGVGTTEKSCYDSTVGDEINIFYSSEKPKLSSSDSLESWQGRIASNLMLLSLFGFVAAVGIYSLTRVDEET